MENEQEPVQKYNLHTHTYRCNHASGEAAEYAEEADKAGINLLGFTEHPPLKPEGIWTPYRMAEEDLDGYFNAIYEARQAFPAIKILAGFEMDLYPRYKSYSDDTYLHRKEIDFLIAGVHWIEHQGDWMFVSRIRTSAHLRKYAEDIISLMESGIFAFITHPDSFMAGYSDWDENTEALAHDILSAAEEYKVPLEINGCGLRKKPIVTGNGSRVPYPHDRFWEKASEYDIEVVYNSDAHKPEDTAAGLLTGSRIIRKNGLSVHDVNRDLLMFSSENRDLNLLSLSAAP